VSRSSGAGWWALAGAAVVLAVAASSRATSSPVPSIAASDRVLVVGDSLAVGMRPGFLELGAGERIPTAVDARGGTVTRQWLSRGWLAAALEAHRPTLVLVSLGTNDTSGQITADELARVAGELAAACRARGARVVWLLPPPMPWKTDAIAQGLRQAGVTALEAPTGLQRAPDRVHMTPDGYRAWARDVWARLRTR
jgi:lysophospholipase L1-like esterase